MGVRGEKLGCQNEQNMGPLNCYYKISTIERNYKFLRAEKSLKNDGKGFKYR